MSNGFFHQRSHYQWIAALWTIGIVIACSLPPSTLSAAEPTLGYDKLAHFGLFAGLGFLWFRGLCSPKGTTRRHLWRMGRRLLLVGVLFAVGTEVYQEILPIERTAELYDALADSAGLVVGLGTYLAYAIYRRSAPRASRSE